MERQQDDEAPEPSEPEPQAAGNVPPVSPGQQIPPGYPAPWPPVAPPGYYYALVPVTPPPPPPSAQPATLGAWGLACSVFGLLALVLSLTMYAGDRGLRAPSQTLVILSLVAAILGVVLSWMALSGRHARTGAATAGLVVGIVAAAPTLFVLLLGAFLA